MKQHLLLFILIFVFLPGYTQKLKTVSADETFYLPINMLPEEAKREGLKRARVKALENEFGSIVSQTGSIDVSIKDGDTFTNGVFVTETDVKGEWIETIEEKVEVALQDNLYVVTCHIKGKAREIISPKIDIITKPLRNGKNIKFESYEFKEGDDLYLYFKSPVDGYLAVFLVDEGSGIVYCALPYRNSDGKPKKIKADTEYILFSIEDSDKVEKEFVDEYVLTVDGDYEYNAFYILFSSEPFTKPIFNGSLEESLPKIIGWKDFQKWLIGVRSKFYELNLIKLLFAIKKK